MLKLVVLANFIGVSIDISIETIVGCYLLLIDLIFVDFGWLVVVLIGFLIFGKVVQKYKIFITRNQK